MDSPQFRLEGLDFRVNPKPKFNPKGPTRVGRINGRQKYGVEAPSRFKDSTNRDLGFRV